MLFSGALTSAIKNHHPGSHRLSPLYFRVLQWCTLASVLLTNPFLVFYSNISLSMLDNKIGAYRLEHIHGLDTRRRPVPAINIIFARQGFLMHAPSKKPGKYLQRFLSGLSAGHYQNRGIDLSFSNHTSGKSDTPFSIKEARRPNNSVGVVWERIIGHIAVLARGGSFTHKIKTTCLSQPCSVHITKLVHDSWFDTTLDTALEIYSWSWHDIFSLFLGIGFINYSTTKGTFK